MRKIEVIQNILVSNQSIACQNQHLMDKHSVFATNIMSSSGAGKASLILQSIAKLRDNLNIAAIKGDDKPIKYPMIFVDAYAVLV